MVPIPKHRKKSPLIFAVPVLVLLAVAPTPVPLAAAPAPVPLPVVPAPVPVAVVVGMVPPPTPIPLILAMEGRAPPQARTPTQAEATEPIHPLGILAEIVGIPHQTTLRLQTLGGILEASLPVCSIAHAHPPTTATGLDNARHCGWAWK